MLNSNKGGHIHIGINSSGQIEGVRINFNERDGFRSGNTITDPYFVVHCLILF